MPQLINKQTVFPLTAEEMGPLMLPIVDAGASYVGGAVVQHQLIFNQFPTL